MSTGKALKLRSQEGPGNKTFPIFLDEFQLFEE